MKSLAVLLCLLCASAHSQVLVFNPGEGVTTNVEETLADGYAGLEVQSGSVNLLSRWNSFAGPIAVGDGASLGAQALNLQGLSSLGVAPGRITLGKASSFRYLGTGKGELSAAIEIAAGDNDERAAIDTAGDLSATGGIVATSGSLVKKGEGKLTVATPDDAAGTVNTYAANVSSGYELEVEEGTLEFVAPSSVTNMLGDASGSAVDIVSIGSQGRTARLDIRGGRTICRAKFLSIRDNARSASVNIYGGSLEYTNPEATLVVGERNHSDDIAQGGASLNLFGGNVKYQYIQLASSRGGKAKLLVAGGTLSGYGLYVAHASGSPSADNVRVSEAEIHICTNGVVETTMQQLARDSATKVLYKVTDGGTLNLGQPLNAAKTCDCTLVLDGGNVNFNGNSENSTNTIPSFVTTKIGASRSNVFLKHNREYRFAGPVVSALESGCDGGIRFYGAAGARIAFMQGATHTGATHFDGEVALLLHGNLSLAKLASPNNRLKIVYLCSGDAMPMLDLGAVEANSYFNLEFSGVLPDGICDVVSFPASAGLDADDFAAVGLPAGKKAVFSVRESGGRKIVSVAFAARTLETYSYLASGGGDFMADGAWSRPVQSSQNSRLEFSENSAAEATAVNLAVPFVAASIDFTASPGYRLAGEKITLDNAGSPAAVSAGGGKNEIANDLEFKGVASFVAKPSATELKVSGQVAASAVEVGEIASPLSPSYDAGVVTFSADSGYTGDFTVNSGKARVESIADRGIASAAGAGERIVVKFGTFEFAGGEGETDRDFVIDPDDRIFSPAVSVAENSSLTLNGSVLTLRGGLHKTGKGTLVLGGDSYRFGDNAATTGSHAERFYSASYLPAAYSPMRTFVSLIVGAGTMVWGKDGQVVEFPQDLQIGGRTTLAARKETSAKLVINGGTTVTRALSLGYDHGSSATSEYGVLTNSLVVNGGVLNVTNHFAIGSQSVADCTQHSEFVLNGGTVNCSKYTAIGFGSNPSTLSTVRMVVNGGEFNVLDGDFYIGSRADSPRVEIELNGGLFNSADGVGLRFSSKPAGGGAHSVSLNEGAVLRVKNGLTCTSGAYGAGCFLLFNGGVYQPCGTYGQITSPFNLKVSARPARIDTSYMLRGSVVSVVGTWRKACEGTDGGILVTGSAAQDSAVLFDSSFDCALEGAIVAGPGGVVLSRKDLLAGKNVEVRRGGSFGGVSQGSSAVELKVKSLTLEDGAGISVVSHSATVTSFVSATEKLAQKGEVKVSLIDFNKNYSIWLTPGVFTVLRGPKGTLDATKFRLSDHYASDSEAEFTLNDSNSNYDEVVVELKSAFAAALRDETNAHTWIAEGSGNFDDKNNWDTPPRNQTTDEIIFPADLHAAQIALGDTRRFGKLTSNASGEVALSGGEIDMGDGLFVDPVISSLSGTLRLPSVKTGNNLTFIPASSSTQIVEGAVSAKKMQISPFLHGGTVRVDGRLDVSDVTVYSGRLEAAAPEALGNAQVNIDNASLCFDGSGESGAKISVQRNGDGVIDVRSGEVYSLKPLQCSTSSSITTVFKRGAGTMVFADGESSYWGGSNEKDDAATEPWAFPENGDAPAGKFGSLDVVAGKLVVGINPRQTICTSGFAIIGSQIADFDENGDVLDSELEVRGGVLKIGPTGSYDFYIGRNAGAYRLAKGFASRRRNLTYSQYGGEVYCGTFYMSHDSKNSCYNGKATFNLHGGRFVSAGGYIMLSAHKNSQGAQYGTSLSEINIYGGVFTNTFFNSENLATTTGGLLTTPVGACDFNLNLYGGEFAWTSAITISPGPSTKCRINFAGGKFIAKYLKRNSSNGEVVLFWNGGVFHPTLDEVTLRGGFGENAEGREYSGNIVSTNGAIFEVAAGRKLVVDQGFTSDPDLETRDGGVALTGGGELHLVSANRFTGPVRALGGTVLCGNVSAIPEGVALELSGGRIDLNGHPAIVGDVYGSGGEVFGAELAVEGTVRVIGETGGSLVLGNAVFGALSKFAPRYGPDGETGGWRGDTLKLANASGRIAIDLGRTPETTLEKGFLLKVAELDSASSANLRFVAVNYGDEKRLVAQFNRVVRDDGTVDVYVELVRKRFAIVVR